MQCPICRHTNVISTRLLTMPVDAGRGHSCFSMASPASAAKSAAHALAAATASTASVGSFRFRSRNSCSLPKSCSGGSSIDDSPACVASNEAHATCSRPTRRINAGCKKEMLCPVSNR